MKHGDRVALNRDLEHRLNDRALVKGRANEVGVVIAVRVEQGRRAVAVLLDHPPKGRIVAGADDAFRPATVARPGTKRRSRKRAK